MQISMKPMLSDPNLMSDWANVRGAMLNAIRKAATEIKSDFDATTETWENHHPSWETHPSLAHGMVTVTISPKDNFAGQIWEWIDEGTPAHTITAGIYTGRSDKSRLAFMSDFVPKTRRGVIGSSAGRNAGHLVKRARVNNPGIKARNFSQEIAERNKKWFQEKMQEALNEFARKSKLAMK